MILDRILEDKQVEVRERKAQLPEAELRALLRDTPPAVDFMAALDQRPSNPSPTGRAPRANARLIAEVKKASPSKGLIRPDFDPVWTARTYESAGASCISVLTDEKYFAGSLDYLREIRRAVGIPLLRKDFVVDAYQIYEARAARADAILLIVAALSPDELREFMAVADGLGMAQLVETHTADEMEIALECGARLIGINNRNLQTFETTLRTSMELAGLAPDDRVLVGESGIFTRADVKALAAAGMDAILVGESLMREPDPGVKVRELLTDG